jgi:hypothetical protein
MILSDASAPPKLTPGSKSCWAPGALGYELRFINLQSHDNRLVFQPTTPIVPNLTISPDGRYLCFPVIGRNSQELMMVENIH